MRILRNRTQCKLLQQCLSDHPWAKRYRIEVSPGLIHIVDDFLKEVEAILGSNPIFDFFLITEGYDPESANDEISGLYKRKLLIYYENTINDQNPTLNDAIDVAVSASVEVCFRCGEFLHTVNLNSEKTRAEYPFLPEALSHISCKSTVCLKCAKDDFEAQ
jgi:hypothetical protein